MSEELPQQWDWTALLALPAAVLALGSVDGALSLIAGGLPGAALLAASLAQFAMAGDPRSPAYMALAAAAVMLGALVQLVLGDVGPALGQGLLAGGAWLVAGRIGRQGVRDVEGLPPLSPQWPADAKVALDETMLGYFVGSAAIPSGAAARQMAEDASRLAVLADEWGWRSDPRRCHAPPSLPEAVEQRQLHLYGHPYTQLGFDSGFVPPAELPGAAQWMEPLANRRCNAWMLRHPQAGRPWLLCIHGYRMGRAWLDLSMFRKADLVDRLGVNLLIPTLPLHGPRRTGRRSGDGYLDGQLRDLYLAEMQALWDLRSWARWLFETEGATAVGVYGVSLGGRMAAQLSNYEPRLALTVAALPLVDMAHNLWRLLPTPHRQYFAEWGMDEAALRALFTPMSPLSLPCQVAEGRRHVIVGRGDRVVPPQQALQLARHWQSALHCYQGSHLSYRREPLPAEVLENAVRGAGWLQR